jgi:hypothetical protein
MQKYASKEMHFIRVILFFLFVLFVAYLPVSTFVFFLKNDAFTGYFPPKFFMSESIASGFLPLWNPYINFGIPQYGDMSSGFWSPITWIIASTVGYNAYSFTIETLFYIFIGGIGFYKLTESLNLHPYIRKISALAYLCSGFMVGNLQHFNWISGASFFPWCFWSYLMLLKKFSLRTIIQTSLLFYLLIASAHPGITIGAIYFFLAYILFWIFSDVNRFQNIYFVKALISSHVLFFLFLLIISIGLIIGYTDILPFFTRGDKVSLNNSLLNPTTFVCWVSTLLPFSTVKNDLLFQTDIAMRNCYFSLILFVMLFVSFFNRKDKFQNFLWIIGILFLLLSSGGVFKEFAFKYLPLLGYVRLNGEFRIFALSCFILISALELNKLVIDSNSPKISLKPYFVFASILLFVIIIVSICLAIIYKNSFLFHVKDVSLQNGVALKLKYLINSISFYDTLWIQGTIQLFLLNFIHNSIVLKNWKFLVRVVSFDLIIACLLNLPFTGVGKASLTNVQSVINNSPKGIPIPLLQPISHNDSATSEIKAMVGDWSFYNKQVGTNHQVLYPIMLKNSIDYLVKNENDGSFSENYNHKPFLFLIDTVGSSLQIVHFSPTNLKIKVNSKNNNQLIFQENNYPHWYYKVGKEKHKLSQFGINFMEIPILKGSHELEISFEPNAVKIGMLISTIAIFLCCSFLGFSYFRKVRNNF